MMSRYDSEGPVPFVQSILAILEAHPTVVQDVGLYVGCGNGRNYLPLVNAGLDLWGLDVSSEAVARLGERLPRPDLRVLCGDFRSFHPVTPFGYLIAIQVFQHGAEADTIAYFDNVAMLLKPGGLFFLRVNSINTDIFHRHTVIERNGFGGLTVRYEEGPKRDLLVHFYSQRELAERTRRQFRPLLHPREDVTRRPPPRTGCWAQWEGIWQKTDG